ncbi:hypothetical protein WICPIJ_002832 [Wickerhamomyces pijperi]|uniref:Mitochondrial fission protein n=1 Tax=Wickerhamomyces pijperi TaxID=599730 RepID=A0A9P8Q8F6_WICPI|nr:hypothetical protein WICPIJ_002832 [Wickerhamomyces pijperi]
MNNSNNSSSSSTTTTDLYNATTHFTKAVTLTASALMTPPKHGDHETLLSNSTYKQAMQQALNNPNSMALQRHKQRHRSDPTSLYGSRYASSSEFFKNKFSSSKTAYKILTHIPDELLEEIPTDSDENEKNITNFSLFQGFNAALPAINEEIELNKSLKSDARGDDIIKQITHQDSNSESDEEFKFKLPFGITKEKIADTYSTNKLTGYKDKIGENLDLLEIRKNLAASEIIEIDNKIAKLQELRQLVFKRVAKIEQNELFLETHLDDINDRIQMIKDYNMEKTDEDEEQEHEHEQERGNGTGNSSPAPVSTGTEYTATRTATRDDEDLVFIDDTHSNANSDKEPTPTPLLSQSIYGKLQDKPPRFRKKTHKSRKTTPTLQQYYEPGAEIKEFQAHEEAINCFDFDIPFGTMVSASLDNTVRVWDLSRGKCTGLLEGHNAPVSCIQMDDTIVVTGSLDASLKLWDLSKLHHSYDHDETPCVYTFESHIEEITALSFHNYNLVSGSQDRTLRQWDLQTGHCLQTIDVLWASQMNQTTTLDSSVVNTIDRSNPFIGALQTYDAALATGTSDGVVRLWDLRSGDVIRSLVGHTGPVTCLQFDDRHLATGSMDRSIRIWDLRTGGIHDAFAYESPISTLQFDSRRIVSANNENTVKIYDRLDERHSSCGGKDVNSSIIKHIRYREGYLVEGRADGRIGIWAI